MPAASTIIGIAGLAIGAAGTTYSITAGEAAKTDRKRAFAAQEKATADAKQRAIAQSRQNEEAIKASNRRRPDVSSLLTREQAAAQQGPGQTFLTGAGGVDKSKLLLGKTSTLGGG